MAPLPNEHSSLAMPCVCSGPRNESAANTIHWVDKGNAMVRMMKGTAALAAVMLLAACSDSMEHASITTTTEFEQLSQVDWATMTAASTAAKVSNNNLIMMR